MSTNYYADAPNGERWHIGKRSIGWQFLFHHQIIGEAEIQSKRAWFEILERSGADIFDEYGQLLTVDKLETIVEQLQDGSHWPTREMSLSQAKEYPDSTHVDSEGYNFNNFRGQWF